MALMSGFAMSVKYTSFVVPLACGLLLLFHRPFIKSLSNAAQFSAIAILTALPYYARNAILMENPFYPFAFGGRYLGQFPRRLVSPMQVPALDGTLLELFLLPINTLLGHRDANFFDGRMGPLFLILAPFTIWILISRTRRDSARAGPCLRSAFSAFSAFTAWTVGVINSSALWQGRLLFPALIPFAIPTALAWDSIKAFDTSKLRISFLVNALIAVVIALTLIDNTIFVLQTQSTGCSLGAQSS